MNVNNTDNKVLQGVARYCEACYDRGAPVCSEAPDLTSCTTSIAAVTLIKKGNCDPMMGNAVV